ncbi:MAG: hypothetical protein ACYC7M_10230 [Bellilinea sp.]
MTGCVPPGFRHCEPRSGVAICVERVIIRSIGQAFSQPAQIATVAPQRGSLAMTGCVPPGFRHCEPRSGMAICVERVIIRSIGQAFSQPAQIATVAEIAPLR